MNAAAKKATKSTTVTESQAVVIKEPNILTVDFDIIGETPYVQNAFSRRVGGNMLAAQMEGSRAKSKKQREARNPEAEMEEKIHRGPEGQVGIPCPALRSAMISACRLVGFQMTKAKLSVFVVHDFFDREDGTPLLAMRSVGGTTDPEMHTGNVRLESGVTSIAIRPMWREWSARVHVRFDGDQFSPTDVLNLLARAGMQVGIGEGRPDSRKSHGMGWGLFRVETASAT